MTAARVLDPGIVSLVLDGVPTLFEIVNADAAIDCPAGCWVNDIGERLCESEEDHRTVRIIPCETCRDFVDCACCKERREAAARMVADEDCAICAECLRGAS